MEYAMQVLNRHSPVSGKPTRRKRFVNEVMEKYDHYKTIAKN